MGRIVQALEAASELFRQETLGSWVGRLNRHFPLVCKHHPYEAGCDQRVVRGGLSRVSVPLQVPF